MGSSTKKQRIPQQMETEREFDMKKRNLNRPCEGGCVFNYIPRIRFIDELEMLGGDANMSKRHERRDEEHDKERKGNIRREGRCAMRTTHHPTETLGRRTKIPSQDRCHINHDTPGKRNCPAPNHDDAAVKMQTQLEYRKLKCRREITMDVS